MSCHRIVATLSAPSSASSQAPRTSKAPGSPVTATYSQKLRGSPPTFSTTGNRSICGACAGGGAAAGWYRFT